MNREIKFRAWDKSCNKMRGISGLQDCFSLRSDGVCNEDYVLMQYTGLKDKNGKEIYEGDIVIVKGTKKIKNYVTEIIWLNNGFCLKENNTYFKDYKLVSSGIEIIGNIYETQSSE